MVRKTTSDSPSANTATDLQSDYAELREFFDFQKALIDSSNVCIISSDTQGNILYFNEAASRILGYLPEELIQQHTPLIFHDAKEVEQRARELSEEFGFSVPADFQVFTLNPRTNKTEEREWTYIHKDGSRFPVLLSISVVRNSKGELLGYNGQAVKITDHVLVERALREEEERYRQLFETTNDSIFVLKAGTIIDCNTASLQYFRAKSKADIIGLSPGDLSPEYQPDGEKSAIKAMKLLQQAPRENEGFFAWTHRRLDGTTFEAEVTLTALDLKGELHHIGIIRDVTERNKAARELEKSKNELLTQNENLQLINQFSAQLHDTKSIDQTINDALDLLLSFTNADAATLFSYESSLHQLRISHNRGKVFPALWKIGKLVPHEGSLTAQAMKAQKIQCCFDLSSEQRIPAETRQKLQNDDIHGAIIIPLVYQQLPYGTLNLTYCKEDAFDQQKLPLLETVGQNLSIALSNAQQLQHLEHVASHDSLTGLANRSLLHSTFRQRTQQGMDHAALMLLDLDRFKEINDTLGHHTGDLLLQQIGPRIADICEGIDVQIGRLGGDEFTLLVFQSNLSKDQVLALAAQVQHRLRQPYLIEKMRLEVDVSIGIAFYPENGDNSHELLRSADVAMYNAKRRGLGVSSYQVADDEHSPERLAVAAELSDAIAQQQLCLHFQPKILLDSGCPTGFEALVRWQHPQRGLLYPDSFIPQAEVGEAIHSLTANVLELALAQQQTWRQQSFDFSVSVNLSVRNLIDNRLLDVLRSLMAKYGTPEGALELEITETALMQDTERAILLLNQIAGLGINLSIDDFGTGYSSLSYIRQLPIDALKIDRVFIKNLVDNDQDQVIVRSTISLAHNLNLQVIAEGVEDLGTLEVLKTMKCDLMQGYYIGKPMPAEAIASWLKEHCPNKQD